jgi:hypothetical protein
MQGRISPPRRVKPFNDQALPSRAELRAEADRL